MYHPDGTVHFARLELRLEFIQMLQKAPLSEQVMPEVGNRLLHPSLIEGYPASR
jgi:hypothetical protein